LETTKPLLHFVLAHQGDIFTIFGFAMSVDAYIEPQGLIAVNTIGGVTPATPLTANPEIK
jgi:hypothetical protein